MFLGEHPTTLDDKRRLYLPKKIRDFLKNSELVFSRGFESCIFVWLREDWERANQKNLDNPITDLGARNIRRYLFSGAEILLADKLGRCLVPDHLTKYAHLKSEIVLIGAGDHFEIWDKELWNQYFDILEAQ
ncbi:MAG: division/cell wall cluster transcriptional repressor MraZ [Candidatus Woykebacteria bacterium RIFCSPHIGHO2_12_FULL_43_10]|uniref:Transcriptional regulator MraZ n=2 Tax=Candidatus Woykeibacteriota TaxID=1817899 RepID=A0A1G1WYT7_9BACT|nr:MAG: division/cell wall cluster transcriptional repressor MraZ [Candidatus Woykebacteria bacterium RIFCSPHIGHO2_12_FULL_43_10]OGY29098.1 MAG: division/cell wall cluster transcriptional repressor MraZ [Candidatus Woykebacteria bacterium RIFCSPHIGHO2_02_FULL_43_16b]OGY32895.1 MAG: division/cell wall cluster transcriptional repressor MraZ [Candidatus Woykebacteria bacterium RIFCSPLOWO2_01_FULL_43_14]